MVVNQGDTLSELASKYGTTSDKIASDNNLSNPNLIFVGDKLEVGSVKEENTQPTKVTTSTEANNTVASSYSQPEKAISAEQPQASAKDTQSSMGSSNNTDTNTNVSTSNGTLSDSEAQAVASQMASRTGQSASYWKGIMWRESNNQVHAANPSSSARGLFQLLYGGTGSVQEQINNAVSLYEKQGTQAWALTN